MSTYICFSYNVGVKHKHINISIKDTRAKWGIFLCLAVLTPVSVWIGLWLVAQASAAHLSRHASLADLVGLLVVVPLTLALHEVCHAIAFRAFGYKTRFGYGFLFGFLFYLFVKSNAKQISVPRMILVGLTPLVIMTFIPILLALCAPALMLFCLISIGTNVTGACADVYLVIRILTARLLIGPGMLKDVNDGFQMSFE